MLAASTLYSSLNLSAPNRTGFTVFTMKFTLPLLNAQVCGNGALGTFVLLQLGSRLALPETQLNRRINSEQLNPVARST